MRIASQKVRNFEIVNRIDMSSFEASELKKKIESLEYIVKYAFVVHDKDRKEDGSDVTPHVHIMCACSNTYTIKKIAKDFGVSENMIEKIKSSFPNALNYLTHRNAPKKHQYNEDEVISNFDWQATREKAISKKILNIKKEMILDDILSGSLKRYSLIDRFDELSIPRKYLVEWNVAIERAFKIRMEEVAKNNNRNIDVIYIWGKSGSGKTTLAKIIADNLNHYCFITGSNNDILDGYCDEECLIIDDVRTGTFDSFEEVLKLLDNNTSSRYRSRYYNKVIQAEEIILTSTKSLEEVFNCFYDEEQKQIYRRIPTIFHIIDDMVVVLVYDPISNTYGYQKSFKSPVKSYLEKKVVSDTPKSSKINDIIRGLEK